MMKHYSVVIQVDFAAPRPMPPQRSGKPRHAAGYYQQFFCTEQSKEKATTLVRDHFLRNENDPASCAFRFDHVEGLGKLTNSEQLTHGQKTGLTAAMFDKRNEAGIWYCGEKEHYFSKDDAAAFALTEEHAEWEDDDSTEDYEGKCQACDTLVRVDDMSLCDGCAGKFERDVIRQRPWDYSASAFGLGEVAREKLREEVIRKHGSKLEMLAPDSTEKDDRGRHRNRGRQWDRRDQTTQNPGEPSP
jgi:hypothetical protein